MIATILVCNYTARGMLCNLSVKGFLLVFALFAWIWIQSVALLADISKRLKQR